MISDRIHLVIDISRERHEEYLYQVIPEADMLWEIMTGEYIAKLILEQAHTRTTEKKPRQRICGILSHTIWDKSLI
jgi:hypothetical protein